MAQGQAGVVADQLVGKHHSGGRGWVRASVPVGQAVGVLSACTALPGRFLST